LNKECRSLAKAPSSFNIPYLLFDMLKSEAMKRHKHLFEQVCSFENLHAAATAAMRGKRGKVPAACFFANLEEELVALRTELLEGTYRHGGYHYFRIYEPKERLVAAAVFYSVPVVLSRPSPYVPVSRHLRPNEILACLKTIQLLI
jgi:hypothetical protein